MTRRWILAMGVALAMLGSGSSLSALAAESPFKGDCLNVKSDEVMESIASFEIVPCSDPHNSDVYNVVAYPDNVDAPSKIAPNAHNYFWRRCNAVEFEPWIGRIASMYPVRAMHVVRLPSDAEWSAGARWVACTAVLPNGANGADVYKGRLPSFMAKAPLTSILWCAKAPPKSGVAIERVSCTSKASWMLVTGGIMDGKVGPNYPKDLQPAADALCTRDRGWMLKPGTRGRVVAALVPESDVRGGRAEVLCFISISDWNGKRQP